MTDISTDLNVKGILRRITVLFIFLLNCEVTVVSTGMGAITRAFPGADPVLINLVYTFPILISVFMNFFVVPPLAKRYDKKSLVIVALVLYIIGGVGGVFATGTIFQIIGMRAFVGIGAGIAAPLCGAIINDLYDGRDKENMLGWANGVDSLMAIILVMIAGYLCAIKWNYLFYVYTYFIIVLLMVVTSLPSIPAPAAIDSSTKKKVKLSYNGKQKFKLFLVCLYDAAFTIFLVVMMMKLSIFIEIDAKLGDAIVSSRAISITTAGILIGSLLFGFADKFFKRYTMIVSTLCVAAGTYIMFGAHALAPVFTGCFIVGLGAGLNLPVVQSRALAIGIKADGTFANAMVIGVMNGGQFLATFVEKGVALFAEPTARNLLGSVSIAMIAITVITVIYVITDPLKGVNASSEIVVP
jgi:MFS family permease